MARKLTQFITGIAVALAVLTTSACEFPTEEVIDCSAIMVGMISSDDATAELFSDVTQCTVRLIRSQGTSPDGKVEAALVTAWDRDGRAVVTRPLSEAARQRYGIE